MPPGRSRVRRQPRRTASPRNRPGRPDDRGHLGRSIDPHAHRTGAGQRAGRQRELRALGRYATPKERDVLSEISERIKVKNDLDYQRAQQGALKGWLFVHIPLTYSLIIAVVPHVLLVYGFHGGIR